MKSRIAIVCIALGFFLFSLLRAKPFAAPGYSLWSTPVNLGPIINSGFGDSGACLSKDGLSLYFFSFRPGGFGAQDIWVSHRPSTDAPWGTPWNLGPLINTDGLEAVPSLSRDQHWLFFNSNRDGGTGQIDIWASYRANIHDNFAWGPPVNLSSLNTAFNDAGAWLFDNDDRASPFMFFVSTRPGGLGNFDIYAAPMTGKGIFGPATLVNELNSAANDRRPSVRFDGLEIFFDSDRHGGSGGFDLWASTREDLSQPWSAPVNLGNSVNSEFSDEIPFIAADGQTLFFESNRPGGSGAFDIWVTTRTKLRGR